MKVVSAYRPFEPESASHKKLGPFPWTSALAMLRQSVKASCRCETYALTDLSSDVGTVPAVRLPTTETRLMLWLLEAWSLYIESDAFDDDTAMVSPDALVFSDLRPWFSGDLGVVVRGGKFEDKRPLLNGVQLWAVRAKPRLAAFYREVRRLAARLPEGSIRWGGDTEPILELLEPLGQGHQSRQGLDVVGIPFQNFFRCPSGTDARRIEAGKRPDPTPIVDFKYMKKRMMADYYAAAIGRRTA